jgi:hypothetical protein
MLFVLALALIVFGGKALLRDDDAPAQTAVA